MYNQRQRQEMTCDSFLAFISFCVIMSYYFLFAVTRSMRPVRVWARVTRL